LYLNFDGDVNTAPYSNYQNPGQTQQDIQEILFRTSEVFAPFNVEVTRIFGFRNSFQGNDGSSTIFIGDNPRYTVNGVNGPGGFTPNDYADDPSTYKGFTHLPNSDPFDIAYIDPAGGSPLATQTPAQTVRGIVHEAGHTFGLVHVRTDLNSTGAYAQDPAALGTDTVSDVMSYTPPANNLFFSKQTFNVTNYNQTPTGLVLQPSLQPFWWDTSAPGDTPSIFPIVSQSSFTYLQTVLGLRTPDAYAHVSDLTSVDLSLANQMILRAPASQPFVGYIGAGNGRLGDYDVFRLDIATATQLRVDVVPWDNNFSSQSRTLTPVVLVHDQNGQLVQFNDSSYAAADNANEVHGGYFNVNPGRYFFIVGARDGGTTGRFTLTVSGPGPVAQNDHYTVQPGLPLTPDAAHGVLANDINVDGSSTAVLQTPVAQGTLILQTNGSFFYSPFPGFRGTDSFTYVVQNANGVSNAATVTLGVGQDPPVAHDEFYFVGADGVTTFLTHGVLGNDTDAESDPMTAVLVTAPSHGILGIDSQGVEVLNPDGTFHYTSDPNFRGRDSFTYIARDRDGDSNIATVTLIVGAPPTANDDVYSGTPGQTLVVAASQGVLANDTDAEGDPMTSPQLAPQTFLDYGDPYNPTPVFAGPFNGTLVLNLNGGFTYIPNNGFHGQDFFYYQAIDRDGTSNVARVTLNYFANPPVANDDSYSLYQPPGGPPATLRVGRPGLLANDADVEGDDLASVLVTPPSHGYLFLGTRPTNNPVIDSGGGFEYRPYANFYGTDTFTYLARDVDGDSRIATVRITVGNDTLALNLSPSSPIQGQTITLTANVSLLAPATGTPTGTVTFRDGSTVLGTAPVDGSGVAVLTTSLTTVGGHTISATYNGDTNFTISSDAHSVTVAPLTSDGISANLSPSAPFTLAADPGSADSIYAAVNGISSAPTGSVLIINLGDGLYSGAVLSPPAGMQVIIRAGNGTFVKGGSPALTVTSGTVEVDNAFFFNTTDTPTILVTGGTLRLRGSTVLATGEHAQPATGSPPGHGGNDGDGVLPGTQPAIRVTGGSLNLGTMADPGGNTIEANATGQLIEDTGSNPLSIIGNNFDVDGVPGGEIVLAAAAESVTVGFDGTYGIVTGLSPTTFQYLPGSFSQLVLDGDTGGNVFNIQGVGAGTHLAIDGGPNDVVNVGNTSNGLDDLHDLVTLNGTGGNVALVVNDVQGTGVPTNLPVDATNIQSSVSYSVTAQDVNRTAGYGYSTSNGGGGGTSFIDIVYQGIASLELKGSNLGATYDIASTAVPTSVVSNGASYVSIGGAGRATQDIAGPVNVTNPNGATILIVDDSYDTVGRAVTVSNGRVSGLSPADVTWTATPPGSLTGVGRLILDGGSGDNTFNVLDTDTFYQYAAIAPGTGASTNIVNVHATTAPLYVYGNGATDLVTVGSGAAGAGGSLADIRGSVNVIGYGGVTSLVVDDQGSTTQEVYEVFATEVDRTQLPDAQGNYVPDVAPITYTGLSSLTLYASTSSYNVFYVEGTAAGTRTDIYGGSDNSTPSQITVDEFVVSGGPGDTLDDIQGPLNLHGQTTSPGGESLVILNDSSTVGGRIYTLTAGGINRTAMVPITFDDMVYDELYTSQTAAAAINVQGVAASGATIVIAGAGDLVTVGFADAITHGNTLAAIQGPLIIDAGYINQVPSVVIDDSGDATDHPHAKISPDSPYYDYQLTGLAPAPIYFGLAQATPLSILAGRGNDTFTVAGPVSYTGITIDGGGGANTLIYDDQATTASETYTVTATTVGETGAGSIGYANMANVAVYAGSGTVDVVNVNSTAPGTTTDVYGGTTNSQAATEDVLYVGNGLLDAVKGPVALHGRTGLTIVGFGDWANAQAGQTYNLTSGALKRPGKAPITYDGLIYYDGLATSQSVPAVVNVQSNGNLPTYIGMGPGDVVTFGSQAPALGGTLAQIQGSVFLRSYGYVPGLPSVVVDDSGDGTAHPNVALSAYPAPDNLQTNDYQLTGLVPATVTFEWSLDRATPIRILGGLANDTFIVENPVSFTGITIDGGGGANTLVGPATANTWTISGGNQGTLGSVAFTAMQILAGGSASDVFKFQTSGSLSGSVDGGAGVNTLDYSAYKGDIAVDLALHLASLVNKRAMNSVSNIQNVIGSQGNDMLVGDTNANVFIAGTGRNVLIGGAGADTLDASASEGDNILIGGSTDWDKNIQALDAIMAEWTRSDINSKSSFQSRYNDLVNGTGTTNPLNVLTVNGQRTLILLTPATNPKSNNGTVHADGALDTLKGTNLTDPSTGLRAHNWFFYDDADAALVNFLSSSDRKNHTT
jgi:hypothetical protein